MSCFCNGSHVFRALSYWWLHCSAFSSWIQPQQATSKVLTRLQLCPILNINSMSMYCLLIIIKYIVLAVSHKKLLTCFTVLYQQEWYNMCDIICQTTALERHSQLNFSQDLTFILCFRRCFGAVSPPPTIYLNSFQLWAWPPFPLWTPHWSLKPWPHISEYYLKKKSKCCPS